MSNASLFGRNLYIYVGPLADYIAPTQLLPGHRRILTDNSIHVVQETDGTNWVTIGFADPAAAPTGTVANYEDFTLAAAATALFTGQTHTYIDITVGQHANAGAAAQYAIVYLVFNSSDPTTDLSNAAIRTRLLVQNGIGQTRRKSFAPGTLVSCHYKCANTSADLVLFAECK